MCGFVGGLLRQALEPKRLDCALETLHHRGPDAVGKWVSHDGRWFLGHTRLSIIGLDNGDQPIANAAGDVQIVVNGEFYGYRAIRERLRAEGCVFTTESDSEIALHLYLREGMNLGRHLRGEFAAVIADRRNNALLAIRDRFGIKPRFRAVLDGAVRERLIADVEVASYLSGGIDSCAVLGLAQRHMDRPIRAFTLCFEDALYDESELARAQAKRSGASFHPVPVSPRALAEAYRDAVWHAETPFVNGHGVAKFLLSRAVRDAGIKVVFTGEGSDEMLAGYAPFRR